MRQPETLGWAEVSVSTGRAGRHAPLGSSGGAPRHLAHPGLRPGLPGGAARG